MCGIFAFLSYNGNPFGLPPLSVGRAASSISHRGPDSTDVFECRTDEYHLNFVFHRLCINDLTTEAMQPFRTGRRRSNM